MTTIYQDAFRNARFQMQISLNKLAAKLGVTKSLISRIENDQQKPSIALLKKLENVSGFSFWALVAGDFQTDNQHQYIKLSALNFKNKIIKLSTLSVEDQNYLRKKFEIEIQTLSEKLKKGKEKLRIYQKKVGTFKKELEPLEKQFQEIENNLAFLKNNNAPQSLLLAQQTQLNKAKIILEEKKRKKPLINSQAIILAQIAIEEIKLKIQLRQEKIAELKALT